MSPCFSLPASFDSACSPTPYTLRVSKLHLGTVCSFLCVPLSWASHPHSCLLPPACDHPHPCPYLRPLSGTLGPHCPLSAGSWMLGNSQPTRPEKDSSLLLVCSPAANKTIQYTTQTLGSHLSSFPSPFPPGLAGHPVYFQSQPDRTERKLAKHSSRGPT